VAAKNAANLPSKQVGSANSPRTPPWPLHFPDPFQPGFNIAVNFESRAGKPPRDQCPKDLPLSVDAVSKSTQPFSRLCGQCQFHGNLIAIFRQ
jgi:hypothetical protein